MHRPCLRAGIVSNDPTEMKADTKKGIVWLCGESSPVVQCQVGTTVTKFIINTGSKAAFVKEFVLRNYKRNVSFNDSEAHAHTELYGITGKPLKTMGCFDILFKIGSTIFRHPCLACADDVMLSIAGIFGQIICWSIALILWHLKVLLE